MRWTRWPRKRSCVPSKVKRSNARWTGFWPVRLIEEAVERRSSPNVERALREALDSEMVDRLWEQLLASDEVQQLFEHIGEAPELRAAIARRGGPYARSRNRSSAPRDKPMIVAESVVRRVLRRPRRTDSSPHAGIASRALAFVIDVSMINVAFLALSGLVAFLVSTSSMSASEYRGPRRRHGAVAGRRGGLPCRLLGPRRRDAGNALRRDSPRVEERPPNRSQVRAAKIARPCSSGRPGGRGDHRHRNQPRAPWLAGPSRADKRALWNRDSR